MCLRRSLQWGLRWHHRRLERPRSFPDLPRSRQRAGEFTVFEHLNKTQSAFVAGAVAGGLGTIIGCPMQVDPTRGLSCWLYPLNRHTTKVVKINLQNSDKKVVGGVVDLVRCAPPCQSRT